MDPGNQDSRPAEETTMTAPRPPRQLALPVVGAAADRPALAAHLVTVARLRGRAPVPKPGGIVGASRAVGEGPAAPGGHARASRRITPTAPDLGAVAAFRASARLTSVDPAANRFRFYALAWRPTLWGDFALVQTWGRLGGSGRSRTTVYASRAAAQGEIARLLRRRLRRGYRVAAWT
jgi:predicted DNA-binding WGR domain protein